MDKCISPCVMATELGEGEGEGEGEANMIPLGGRAAPSTEQQLALNMVRILNTLP